MSAAGKPTLAQLKARHPFPWRYVCDASNRLRMLDAANQEVGLFDILDLAVSVTTAAPGARPAANPPSAPL